MNITFEGKTALVTGAGKGIGENISLALASGGAKVYAVSRTLADLEKLKAKNDKIKPVVCDLADWDATEKTIGALGPVDLLVNNAGRTSIQPFLEVTKEDFDNVFDVNVRAVLQVSQIICRGMVSRGAVGAVVNISSQASLAALTSHTTYCASKSALDSITRSMAHELGPKKIRVNSCNPTVVMTDMGQQVWGTPEKSGPVLSRIPLRRFADLEDVTNTVLYLLSDKSAMLNGVILPVDGGLTISGV